MTEASLEQNVTAARREHLVPGREVHLQDMRGQRFCEVGLITGSGEDNAVANIWNTTGACEPAPAQLGALDADAIARENRAVRAWLSPVRSCMFDRLDVWEAGEDRTFGAMTATWTGAVDAATLMQATVQDSYHPGYIYRDSTFAFDSGTEVYLLEAPDGEVFVMESLCWDPSLTEDNLAHLSRRLDLPGGWGFRAELLDEDLKVTSNPDKLAHVLQDDLHNVYQGSDAGRAFSRFCQDYERW
jgi:hypothetical protein